jgi:hypothetical protein
LKYIWYYFIG